MVGLDVFSDAANNVINNIEDEKEKSEFKMPKLVLKFINNGNIGDKAKLGFYKTIKAEKGNQMLVWDDDKDDYVELVGERLGAVEVALLEKNPLKAILAGQSEECKFVWEITKNILLYCARKVQR